MACIRQRHRWAARRRRLPQTTASGCVYGEYPGDIFNVTGSSSRQVSPRPESICHSVGPGIRVYYILPPFAPTMGVCARHPYQVREPRTASPPTASLPGLWLR